MTEVEFDAMRRVLGLIMLTSLTALGVAVVIGLIMLVFNGVLWAKIKAFFEYWS